MKKDIALKVENVTKSFKLPIESTTSLKRTLTNRLKRIKGYKKQHVLKGISFEVEKGDFFGIVGRNGSGKSTLLKIISQIYVPDRGTIDIDGKLVSFIELGVGFNPELTGRENVYLNGAMLGFSNEEVSEMYDEIVEFADLQEFMDQKLKNYSSGMQVRLAFSVAIKARGDILILDEVLAVGDEAFQRKCNEYFLQRKKQALTTILVTHDMSAVRNYCNKAIMVESGEIVVSGCPEDIANSYSLYNFQNDHSGNADVKGTVFPKGLCEFVPKLEVVSKGRVVLNNDEVFECSINFELTKDKPVGVAVSLIDVVSNRSLIDDRSFYLSEKLIPVAKKMGEYSIDLSVELSDFNQGEFLLSATVYIIGGDGSDESNREWVAFTYSDRAARFKINNINKIYSRNNGILNKRFMWGIEENV